MLAKTVAAAVWTILLITAALAQNSRGSLRGAVQDTTGARIPSAKIVVQAVDSSLRRESLSEDRGEFRLDDLLPGVYRSRVSAAGFAPAHTECLHCCEFRARCHGHAKASGRKADSATCKRKPPPSRRNPWTWPASCTRASVTSHDLETLPLAARSFANIAYLAPGTEPVEPSDPTKARITAVSTGGSSGLNNELSVDGGDNSDDWIGGFLQNFSPDAIQEFAVRTSQRGRRHGRHNRGISGDHHQARQQRLAWQRSFLRASRRAQRALPDRESGTQSEAAFLTPELRRARSAVPSNATSYGSFPPSSTCTRMPASLTAQPARRSSMRWRNWRRMA